MTTQIGDMEETSVAGIVLIVRISIAIFAVLYLWAAVTKAGAYATPFDWVGAALGGVIGGLTGGLLGG